MDLNQVRQEVERKKALLLDVREQEEWDKEHFCCARLLPLSQLEEQGIPEDLPRHQTIYIHCRRGGRAERATEMLKQKYSDVFPLKYTFEDLKAYFQSLSTSEFKNDSKKAL